MTENQITFDMFSRTTQLSRDFTFETFSRTTQLSRDFALEEFFRSDIAEKVGGDMLAQQIAGMKDDIVVGNLARLATSVLQPMWDNIGPCFTIISGFRGKLLNQVLSHYGIDKSHRTGRAVDIVFRNYPKLRFGNVLSNTGDLFMHLVNKIDMYPIDYVIHKHGIPGAPAWVHVEIPAGTNEPKRKVLYHGYYTAWNVTEIRPW